VSRTMHKVVLAYARRKARCVYIRLLVWWYTRPCHSFNIRRTMLYGRRYVKVVETVEGNGVVHHLDVDSSESIGVCLIFSLKIYKLNLIVTLKFVAKVVCKFRKSCSIIVTSSDLTFTKQSA
jgi:hypothetical protein